MTTGWAGPWPVDPYGRPAPKLDDGSPNFGAIGWPNGRHTGEEGRAPVMTDGRPDPDWDPWGDGVMPNVVRKSWYADDVAVGEMKIIRPNRMRLPAFLIAAGVVAAAVVAFLLPVHDNFSVRCPGQGAVGAIQADANGYVAPDLSVQSVPGFDSSAANAQILASEQAVITSKVRACHDSGETRLLIAGAILVVAVTGSRFVPDVAQRERA